MFISFGATLYTIYKTFGLLNRIIDGAVKLHNVELHKKQVCHRCDWINRYDDDTSSTSSWTVSVKEGDEDEEEMPALIGPDNPDYPAEGLASLPVDPLSSRGDRCLSVYDDLDITQFETADH